MFVGAKGEAYEAVSIGSEPQMPQSDDSKYREKDRVADRKGGRMAFWENHIWHLKIQTALALFNFTLVFIFLVVASTVGLRMSRNVGDSVNVYWKAMNLTPDVVERVMNDTRGILGNAHSVTANMVPISTATANAMLTNDTESANVTFANAATSVMTGLARSDWRSVTGNVSLALGSISNINYTAITGIFQQAQDPAIQSSLKLMSQHALGSFDYATTGMTSLFNILKEGVITEDKRAEKDKRAGKEKIDGPPSDLAVAGEEFGNVGDDVKAAIAAYQHDHDNDNSTE
jgi:hypothetical protein